MTKTRKDGSRGKLRYYYRPGIERAVNRAHATYEKTQATTREPQTAELPPRVEPDAHGCAPGPPGDRVTGTARLAGRRHLMLARPDGRAGGGGSARHPGEPNPHKEHRMPRSSKRPRLTDAERDARRQAERERVEQAARALLTTDGRQRWIKVRASNGLARYSLRNQLLIAIDCHARGITPTYVAGFKAFLALNRCVRKGEKAIHILAPVTGKQRRRARRTHHRNAVVRNGAQPELHAPVVMVAPGGWSAGGRCRRVQRGPLCSRHLDLGCGTGARSIRIVRGARPIHPEVPTQRRRHGWRRLSIRTRAAGSSSSRMCAVPVRHAPRQPLLLTRTSGSASRFRT